MRYQLNFKEIILFEAIKHGCVSVRLNSKKELIIEHETAPDYLVPRRIAHINGQEALKRLVEARLWYLWENNRLYILEAPKVPILPFELRAERIDKGGVLILSVDGEEYAGFKEIAKAIYGSYRKDMLKEIGPYIRKNFDLQEVVLVRIGRKKKRKVPVYRWRGYDFYGIEAVEKKLFWLGEKDLEKLKRLEVENRVSLAERRADQLIRLFDITREGNSYCLTDPSDQKKELKMRYKKEVLGYIRQHEMGGSVSKETSRQIFETVEGEARWE